MLCSVSSEKSFDLIRGERRGWPRRRDRDGDGLPGRAADPDAPDRGAFAGRGDAADAAAQRFRARHEDERPRRPGVTLADDGLPSGPVSTRSIVRASAWLASERTSVSSGARSSAGIRSSTSVEIFRA